MNQDEVSNAYYNQIPISLLTAMIRMNKNGEMKKQGFIVISDSTCHMTQAVYTCYKKLQAYAKSQMDFIQHTYIITDGSGQQFKNRFQFMNLSCHKEDFGSYASWIFTATGTLHYIDFLNLDSFTFF